MITIKYIENESVREIRTYTEIEAMLIADLYMKGHTWGGSHIEVYYPEKVVYHRCDDESKIWRIEKEEKMVQNMGEGQQQRLPKFMNGLRKGKYTKEQIWEFVGEWERKMEVAENNNVDPLWRFLGFLSEEEYIGFKEKGEDLVEILKKKKYAVRSSISHVKSVSNAKRNRVRRIWEKDKKINKLEKRIKSFRKKIKNILVEDTVVSSDKKALEDILKDTDDLE